jgi:hypothetical protein
MLFNVDTRYRLLLISVLYLKLEGEVTWGMEGKRL